MELKTKKNMYSSFLNNKSDNGLIFRCSAPQKISCYDVATNIMVLRT